jgi:enoyl-CoA hydratase/carnithine racemase
MADVLTDTVDGVRIITLNRPERHNAINDEMGEALAEAWREAPEDDAAIAVLVKGEGKSFCSGRDVAVLGQRARQESDFHFVRRSQVGRMQNQLDSPKPIVAALKGAVLGGGCEMALACDVRISSTDLKMALPEINYGILPDTGGTQLMTALIGPSRTKYMVLSGERIDAQTALAWGAVDFVVAPEELDERAFRIAKTFAGKPPIALAMGKMMVDQMHMGAIKAGIGQELLAQTALFQSEDYKEARAALREGRPPVYKGR